MFLFKLILVITWSVLCGIIQTYFPFIEFIKKFPVIPIVAFIIAYIKFLLLYFGAEIH